MTTKLNYSIDPITGDAPPRVHFTRLEGGTIVSTINTTLAFHSTRNLGWETAIITPGEYIQIVAHAYDYQYVEMMHRDVVERLITGQSIDGTTYYPRYIVPIPVETTH